MPQCNVSAALEGSTFHMNHGPESPVIGLNKDPTELRTTTFCGLTLAGTGSSLIARS